jgi:hypothetical protein
MNYIYVGEINVTTIKNKLIELGEEIWLEHTLRQRIFDVHTTQDRGRNHFHVEGV